MHAHAFAEDVNADAKEEQSAADDIWEGILQVAGKATIE